MYVPYRSRSDLYVCAFFFHYTAPTEIYTLSLHDALPILPLRVVEPLHLSLSHTSNLSLGGLQAPCSRHRGGVAFRNRSEEHTSELQSHSDLVCRLLLEKKKINLDCIMH